MALHKTHKAVYAFIRSYSRRHQFSPTMREIESRLKRSRGSVQNSIKRLEEEGYITSQKGKSRSIALVKQKAKKTPSSAPSVPSLPAVPLAITYQGLPVKGEIAAGFCHEPFTEVNDFLNFETSCQSSDYVLKVSGDSMIDAGILDGAYVGIRPVSDAYQPKPGEIVAVWVEGQGTTLKHFYQKGSIVILEAANSQYEPMLFDLETCELKIQGTHLFTWQPASASQPKRSLTRSVNQVRIR